MLIGIAVILSLATAVILVAPIEAAQPLNASENNSSLSLDPSKITTTWNLSFLYKDKNAAKAEYERLNSTVNEINRTYRPRFSNLTGTTLLDYIQSDENYSKSFNVLRAYISV